MILGLRAMDLCWYLYQARCSYDWGHSKQSVETVHALLCVGIADSTLLNCKNLNWHAVYIGGMAVNHSTQRVRASPAVSRSCQCPNAASNWSCYVLWDACSEVQQYHMCARRGQHCVVIKDMDVVTFLAVKR